MIDEKIKNQMKTTISGMVGVNDGLTNSRIKKADYDKTLIGFVSAKIVPENPKDDNDYRWRIQTNCVAYDIKPSSCNITSVGQRVRLFVPNHKMKDKYAEVIESGEYNHPTKVVYDMTDDTITETWALADNTELTKTYQLTVINKNTSSEEVTEIIFPDGTIMKLEGFVIG